MSMEKLRLGSNPHHGAGAIPGGFNVRLGTRETVDEGMSLRAIDGRFLPAQESADHYVPVGVVKRALSLRKHDLIPSFGITNNGACPAIVPSAPGSTGRIRRRTRRGPVDD